MRTFRDARGDTWEIALNVAAIKRVRAILKIDLADPTSAEQGEAKPIALVARLDTDLYLLPDVLFVLCQRQAEERSITDEDFGQRLGGEAMRLAHDAFFQEWLDFFRHLGREDLAKVIEKEMSYLKKAIDLAEAAVNSEAMDRRLDANLAQFGTRLTNALESSASIPTPGPSAT